MNQTNAKQQAKQYRQAARRGDAGAMYALSNCYHEGNGVPRNKAKAKEWYDQAFKLWREKAEQGDAEAQYRLAGEYHFGKDGCVPKDKTEAVKWYRQAAEQGHIKAQLSLAACYDYGSGIPEDWSEARQWYCTAAEQGDAEAQYEYGRFIESTFRDKTQAVDWYRKAAEQGHPRAKESMSECYFRGQCVPKDETEAMNWLRKAAEESTDDYYRRRSYMLLGLRYLYYRNDKEAVKCFRKAANPKGHVGENSVFEAQFMLGECYRHGWGVPKNEKKAVEWYRKEEEYYAESGIEHKSTRKIRIECW